MIFRVPYSAFCLLFFVIPTVFGGYNDCEAYTDSRGLFHERIICPKYLFCCGDCEDRSCCGISKNELKEKKCNKSPTNTNSTSESIDSAAGGIVGGIIAALVVIGVIAAIAYCCCCAQNARFPMSQPPRRALAEAKAAHPVVLSIVGGIIAAIVVIGVIAAIAYCCCCAQNARWRICPGSVAMVAAGPIGMDGPVVGMGGPMIGMGRPMVGMGGPVIGMRGPMVGMSSPMVYGGGFGQTTIIAEDYCGGGYY